MFWARLRTHCFSKCLKGLICFEVKLAGRRDSFALSVAFRSALLRFWWRPRPRALIFEALLEPAAAFFPPPFSSVAMMSRQSFLGCVHRCCKLFSPPWPNQGSCLSVNGVSFVHFLTGALNQQTVCPAPHHPQNYFPPWSSSLVPSEADCPFIALSHPKAWRPPTTLVLSAPALPCSAVWQHSAPSAQRESGWGVHLGL